MFWFWVGAVIVVVLAFAAWSTWRAKRVHAGTSVRSQGALYGRRDGISETGAAQTRAEMEANRGDQQLM